MMAPRDEWHLDTRHLGRRVLVFDSLNSTSTCAAGLAADPANDGVVILADEQTAGRGQHGRSWQCPGGEGVLMSVLLFPPPAVRRPAVLAAWAAVAVCETVLRMTGAQAKIKWPNDVLVRGRKVCGILIEQGRGTVVGIGLNVLQDAEAFARAGLPQAASLAHFTNRQLGRDTVARALIRTLDEGYAALCQGNLSTLETCWQGRLGLLGKQVAVECSTEVHRGRLLEVAFDGLVLERDDKRTLRLMPESVRHLHPLEQSEPSPDGMGPS
ncbi:MAG: biotin--[acetyl-CoA-carboxylase] ligase [Gemmataceae bacterium]|nr:biotin--[acetyl-CoA-carboxylase] ligase [Gemmataceae bacterium]